MTQIESIQAEIESLSSEDFARLAAWMAERDWQNWDRQIEGDSAAGKLDFLRDEVAAAKQQGKLRDLLVHRTHEAINTGNPLLALRAPNLKWQW